jgi:hypothetical protein
MKWFNEFIRYRFWISLVLLALGVVINITSGFWPAFILYLAAVIMLFTHFFLGPLRLIQEHLEDGDFDKAEKCWTWYGFPDCYTSPLDQFIIHSKEISP